MSDDKYTVTFHDPCYLGRHNQVFEAPRENLKSVGLTIIEMPRNEAKSFCCGAGGAQMWKEEENGTHASTPHGLRRPKSTGANTLAVGCPFCMTMLSDASKADGSAMEVKDVAEIVAEQMKK